VIDRDHLARLTRRELQTFVRSHPRSQALYARGRQTMLGGVPMNWMNKWATADPLEGGPSGFPLFVAGARGATITDVDGQRYIDFCLGDTGAMTGHSPPAVQATLRASAAGGYTFMLPTEAAIEATSALAQWFGLPSWQLTVSATDANRFAIRLARALTGRRKILVFNHCYHGSVDESFATLDAEQHVVERPFNMGAPVPPAQTTRVVEFNDLPALERELAGGDVACVLTEPALTNVGIVLPEPGFHAQLRELTRRTGTLLIVDETHTISAGHGGYTTLHALEPDMLTIGKAIASGIPAGAYGLSAPLTERIGDDAGLRRTLTEGIGTGGTLAGNALTARVIAVTLREVLTAEALAEMVALGGAWAEGVREVIHRHALPWHVTQLGARAEYAFRPSAARTGAELAAAGDEELERFLRLHLINRGILTTPFHNMALMSPATRREDVDRHTRVLDEAVTELLAVP
jgi:glutamate-1-semialdehyde 2,1-aminomutase